MSRKTVWVKRFLENLPYMCDVKFDRVLFYYAEWQDSYKSELKVGPTNNPQIEFREGLPEIIDYTLDNNQKKLLILDDLMHEAAGGSTILDLFTKGCHHKNISVIFITQNIFYKGQHQRDLSLNTNYLVLFKNPRDRAQIQHLAHQVYPENPQFLQEAYMDATSQPHTYLLLDLRQDTPDNFRFRACRFPDDPIHYTYVSKNRR